MDTAVSTAPPRRRCAPPPTPWTPASAPPPRVQLEMPPQAMERLQRLKDKTEAASYAEVIRNALRVFEALVQEHENGAEFSLKRANGDTVAYKIFV
ncbi:MAG: ribbon-helix-helix protein, CopG family [Rhizomicrobium sp.]